MYTSQLYSVQCTVVQCTMHSSTVYTSQYYSVHYTLEQFTLYSCIVYTAQCYSVHCTVLYRTMHSSKANQFILKTINTSFEIHDYPQKMRLNSRVSNVIDYTLTQNYIIISLNYVVIIT